jgi:hypothetical protein
MRTFKQKALLAALTSVGALAMSSTSNAVYVNNDGLGQVLIYPYYTVRGGNTTLISVVNTTNQAKAVKVRFLDGKNSAEVIDFNLFLSAKDVWTAAVIPNAAGATLVTADKSCTNPKIPAAGVDFRNFQFVEDGDEGSLLSLDRTREGYLEMIEMATIPTATALGKDVTHVAGVPACKLTSDASTAAVATSLLSVPSGGLFGTMTVVSGAAGYASSVDATALDGWFNTQLAPSITGSGALEPNLGSGLSLLSAVNDSGTVYVSQWANSWDAVSATMMHSQVFGEYAFTTDGVIGTDWVLTMPTKRAYVFSDEAPTLRPFQREWSTEDGIACDDVGLSSTDREEFVGVTNDDFSPRPPRARGNSLCYEANVISFGATASTTASSVLGSTNFTGINPVQNSGLAPVPVGKEGGWLDLSFTNPSAFLTSTGGQSISTLSPTATAIAGAHSYRGLPVIGFAINDFNAGSGSAAVNYNASAGLRFARSITPAFVLNR